MNHAERRRKAGHGSRVKAKAVVVASWIGLNRNGEPRRRSTRDPGRLPATRSASRSTRKLRKKYTYIRSSVDLVWSSLTIGLAFLVRRPKDSSTRRMRRTDADVCAGGPLIKEYTSHMRIRTASSRLSTRGAAVRSARGRGTQGSLHPQARRSASRR